MTETKRRVAVVTGGASGIGRAITLRLAREGHDVAVLDVNASSATAVADEAAGDDRRAIGIAADVSDRAQVDAALATVRSELGPISVVVTSAAIAPQRAFAELTLEEWNRVLAINLTGTFNVVQSAMPDMEAAGWGRVVLISSSSAQRGAIRMAHYASSKGGVIALTKALALECSPLGITINNIAPSSVTSPSLQKKQAEGTLPPADVMARNIPVGRLGVGDDIAGACAYLVSEDASFVTGQTISVNGGSFVG